MLRSQALLVPFCAVVLLGILWSAADAPAAANKDEGKVAGILVEKKETWITVKADGEEEPVKYVLGKDADKKLIEAFKTVFNASRVELTYRKDGDDRRLLGIKRQIPKKSGTVTGLVVKVYDKFWVEIKPKIGPADAFAPGGNFKDKAFMEKLNGLQAGDLVTITYSTDTERHRIQTLRIDKRAK